MKLVIEGNPISKNRPRAAVRGKHVHIYSDQEDKTNAVKKIIKAQVGRRRPHDGAIEMRIFFYMPIPTSTSKKKKALMSTGKIFHEKKPDVDNMVKFYMDCMNGIIWDDDKRVVSLLAVKCYDENPRTEIYLAPANIINLRGRVEEQIKLF